MKATLDPLGILFEEDEADLLRLHAEITERPIENYLRMCIHSLLYAALEQVLTCAEDEETRTADKERFAALAARLDKWDEEDAARCARRRAARAG